MDFRPNRRDGSKAFKRTATTRLMLYRAKGVFLTKNQGFCSSMKQQSDENDDSWIFVFFDHSALGKFLEAIPKKWYSILVTSCKWFVLESSFCQKFRPSDALPIHAWDTHPFLLYQRPPTCFTARQVGNEGHTHTCIYIYTPLYVHEYMEILWHVEWNNVCIAAYRSKFCMWLHFSVAALHYLRATCNISEQESKICSPKRVKPTNHAAISHGIPSVKACWEAAKTLLPMVFKGLNVLNVLSMKKWRNLRNSYTKPLCQKLCLTMKNFKKSCNKYSIWKTLLIPNIFNQSFPELTSHTSSQHDPNLPTFTVKHPHIIHHLRSARQLWASGIHMVKIGFPNRKIVIQPSIFDGCHPPFWWLLTRKDGGFSGATVGFREGKHM